MPKYEVFSGPNAGKYGPQKTLYLDIFHAVKVNSLQKDFIEIVMNKAMVEVYIELLRDVFQNLEGAENFIKQRIGEICE